MQPITTSNCQRGWLRSLWSPFLEGNGVYALFKALQVVILASKVKIRLSVCRPWRHMRSGVITQLILNLSTSWDERKPPVLGRFHPAERVPSAFWIEGVGWATERVSTRRKDLLLLSRIDSRFLSYPFRSLVSIPTELSLILILVVGCEIISFAIVDGEEADLRVCRCVTEQVIFMFALCINDNRIVYYPTNAQYIICR